MLIHTILVRLWAGQACLSIPLEQARNLTSCQLSTHYRKCNNKKTIIIIILSTWQVLQHKLISLFIITVNIKINRISFLLSIWNTNMFFTHLFSDETQNFPQILNFFQSMAWLWMRACFTPSFGKSGKIILPSKNLDTFHQWLLYLYGPECV